MKYLIILLFLKTLFTVNYTEKNKSGNNNYIITKIDSINNIYLVYAERNDSIFKIVSVMCDSLECNQIKIGEFYNFTLESTFPPNCSNIYHLYGQKICGTSIKFEQGDKIVWGIYVTNHLKGLCYIENPTADTIPPCPD